MLESVPVNLRRWLGWAENYEHYCESFISKKARKEQVRSDGGGYRYLYPPKSAQVNFLWGKNDVRTAIQQFYTPSKKTKPKTYTPLPKKNKFLATPLAKSFVD